MNLTNEQRWSIARFCGWKLRPCKGKEDDCNEKDCGRWLLFGPSGTFVGWSKNDIDDLRKSVPRYEMHPHLIGPMLLAMVKAGLSPWIVRLQNSGVWGVCVATEYVRGKTLNEALCGMILKIVESMETNKEEPQFFAEKIEFTAQPTSPTKG